MTDNEACKTCQFGIFRGGFFFTDGPCLRLDDEDCPDGCPEKKEEEAE